MQASSDSAPNSQCARLVKRSDVGERLHEHDKRLVDWLMKSCLGPFPTICWQPMMRLLLCSLSSRVPGVAVGSVGHPSIEAAGGNRP